MSWSDVLISVVSVILTALASWGVARLTAWLNTKISDTNAKSLLNSALETVTSVVKQVYQTYVEELKDTDAWTEEAQKTALSSALSTAKTLMSTKVQSYITENYGDLETWLTTQIESVIYSLKYGSTASDEETTTE